jgi:hypothetical protein
LISTHADKRTKQEEVVFDIEEKRRYFTPPTGAYKTEVSSLDTATFAHGFIVVPFVVCCLIINKILE